LSEVLHQKRLHPAAVHFRATRKERGRRKHVKRFDRAVTRIMIKGDYSDTLRSLSVLP